MDSECVFCRIAAGQIPADVVHRTDRVVAFRDLNPQAPTHLLLIPVEHIRDLTEVGGDQGGLLSELVGAARHLAKAEGIADSGWRLVGNVGPDAGQSVFHLHLHLLGGRQMGWPPG